MTTETLREHDDGKGFTLTTDSMSSAFKMADKMANSGRNYSIKLSGSKAGGWTVVVDEVE